MAARSPSNDSITSPTTDSATNGLKGSSTNGGGESRKSSLKSPDPTPYVTKARVTRPIPPPPSYNPMQFVQIKPCNLYQTAQEQLKKAEEVKKIKEIKKEEPEDWQNNLDNWKSSRRKRVEHIIDRVVEVKKLELEEHDRTRRKSKTFSEMIEERGERGRPRTKLTSLAVYNEDESNDLSDLGIGTSSASGKSSLSEDYDNNSVTSENAELDKAIQDENNLHYKSSLQTREYMASPGYETSSSTAPASSPDPSDLYEGAAIEDYKNRVSRQFRNGSSNMPAAAAAAINNNNHHQNNMHNNNNRNMNGNSNDHQKMPPNTLNIQATSNKDVPMDVYSPRRGNKIEDRLLSFEVTSPSDNQDSVEKTKVDVPKIDISKRKEIFENQRKNSDEKLQLQNGSSVEPPPKVTLRDRFKVAESNSTASNEVPSKKDIKRISTGDASMIRERVQSLEQKQPPSSASSSSEVVITSTRSVDIPPVPPLKDRLSSLQNAAKKEEIKKPPIALVDARQLEIMKKEEETAKQRMQQYSAANSEKSPSPPVITETTTITSEMTMLDNNGDDVDAGADADAFDDSGIQTTDEIIVENCGEHTRSVQQLQEEQLNAAIAALAMEEKQLEEAANAVNQIEAEFEELASTSNVATTNATNIATTTTNNSTNNSTNNQQSSQQLPYDMDFSVSATNNLLGESGKSSNSNSINSMYANGDGDNCSIGCSAGDSRSSRESSYNNSNRSSLSQETVIAAPSSSSCAPKILRKPSNEMIHHRNLLKMFKETFKNDDDLVECVEDAAIAVAPPPPSIVVEQQQSHKSQDEFSGMSATAAVAQVFANAAASANCAPESPRTPPTPIPTATPPPPPKRNHHVCFSKPPQSPKTNVRGTPPHRYPTADSSSPVGSPILNRKPNSTFSINGRVEIFNSKTMFDENKKPYLAHLPSEKKKINSSQHASIEIPTKRIEFPAQQNVDVVDKATTASTIVSAEPIQAPSNAANHAAKHTKATPATKTTTTVISTTVNEPQNLISKTIVHPNSSQHATTTEIVVCAPPITILNPDELPKPNTVKALSSCFSQDANSCGGGGGKKTPPMPSPKPLPRTRIPQKTPPQSPTPARRNCVVVVVNGGGDMTRRGGGGAPNRETPKPLPLPPVSATLSSSSPHEEEKKLSIISTTSSRSSESSIPKGVFETTAIVHGPPPTPPSHLHHLPQKKPPNLTLSDPLKPNALLNPQKIASPCEMPALVACSPNESSLFKLASAPPSPIPSPAHDKPAQEDVALCSNFLSHIVPKTTTTIKPETPPQHQLTVEEIPCEKIDVRKLPQHDQVPRTAFQEISRDEIQRCDAPPNANAAAPPKFNSLTKPTSPILAARAAHSKALIETCEKIIAEERAASNQIKSSLSSMPTTVTTTAASTSSSSKPSTPISVRKSKIPKPIQCCIGIQNDTHPRSHDAKKFDLHGNQNHCDDADAAGDAYANANAADDDDSMLVGRLHVVETQIKVTTQTPPASPKCVKKPTKSPNEPKGVKNTIFDFIKKNFGHHEDQSAAAAAAAIPPATNTTSQADPSSRPIEPPIDTVTVDEVRTIQNSKFYLPSDDIAPPPLPKSPAPVNIEITRKITTDEILDETSNSEMAFNQEINDLLDAELNKLSIESNS